MFEELRRGHDGDAAIGTKAQQMRISGDNGRGVGGDCAGQNLVVIRIIGNHGDNFLWLHKARPGKDKFKDIDLQGGGKFEFGIGNDPLEFAVDIVGDAVDNLPLLHQAQHGFRFAIPAEGRNKNIGVDDYFCDRAHKTASAAVSDPSFARFTVREASRVISASGSGEYSFFLNS